MLNTMFDYLGTNFRYSHFWLRLIVLSIPVNFSLAFALQVARAIG